MARGLNKVLIIGHLGNDPEVRYTPSGTAVAQITVATTEFSKDKVEYTEWHRVVFFNRLAEIAGEYLRKGSKVFVEGSLRTRKWQDKNNVERSTTEIIANEMQMLDRKSGPADQGHQEGSYQAPQAQSHSQEVGSGSPQALDAFNDDDIPF